MSASAWGAGPTRRRTGLDEPTAVADVREAVLEQQRLGRPRTHPAAAVRHDWGAQIPTGEGQHLDKNSQGWPKLWANFRARTGFFESKCWAKPHNLGQPCTIFSLGPGHMVVSEIEGPNL
jgi:hypothetical protein